MKMSKIILISSLVACIATTGCKKTDDQKCADAGKLMKIDTILQDDVCYGKQGNSPYRPIFNYAVSNGSSDTDDLALGVVLGSSMSSRSRSTTSMAVEEE